MRNVETDQEVNDMTMKDKLVAFLRDEEGLTTVEYAVAGALIAAAVVIAFTALGARVGAVINGITGVLPPGAPGAL
jgi:pilus assembly protein Flp/PilA